jgi:hypothetical protein
MFIFKEIASPRHKGGMMKKMSRCLRIFLVLWASVVLILPSFSSAEYVDGKLVVRIGIPQSASASLCIKNRCYPVGNVNYGGGGIACPVDTCSCTWIAADSRHKCEFSENGVDHPMVDFPDDWDQLYLKQSEAPYQDVEALSVTYSVNNNPYVFVDSTNADGLGTTLSSSFRIYSGRKNWLRDEVEFRREKKIEDIAGVPFDQLPWMMQMAAYDIGQAGIVKYKLGEFRDQNGCDEFYAYFGALNSNNILAPAGDHASYFPYDGKFLGMDTWRRAERLIEVQWTNRVAGGCTSATPVYEGTNNVYVPRAGDYLLRQDNKQSLYNYLNANSGLNCQTVTNASPADEWNCCRDLGTTNSGVWSLRGDSSHVMMLVDDQGFVPTTTVGKFTINILHKVAMVETNKLMVGPNQQPRNQPCSQVCAQYITNNSIVLPAGVTNYRSDFYMGIADHELGGADPNNVNAPVDFGFLAAAPAFMF